MFQSGVEVATSSEFTRPEKTVETVSPRMSTTTTQQERGVAGSTLNGTNGKEGHDDVEEDEFPTRPPLRTRSEEEIELPYLNTRLANYIATVRQYQVNIKEVTDKFEQELKSVRDTLGEVRTVKAWLQIDQQSMHVRIVELEKENDKLKRKLEKKKNGRLIADNDNRDAQRRTEDAEARGLAAEDELKKLNAANNENSERVANLQKKLDDETRSRVEVEILLMGANEEIEFRKTFQQQLTQMSTTVTETPRRAESPLGSPRPRKRARRTRNQ